MREQTVSREWKAKSPAQIPVHYTGYHIMVLDVAGFSQNGTPSQDMLNGLFVFKAKPTQ